jgi:hypothetical protein
VVPRRLDQGTQQLAVGGLQGGLRVERGSGLSDALGELVAYALEGAEVEHAGHQRGRGDPVGDIEAAEALEGEAPQLELESADLATQLGAGEELGAGRRARLDVSQPEQFGRCGSAGHRIVCSSGLVASSVCVKT